ncbi:amidohydrolase family protein [Deferribacteraceae bacterium V6Fe1]|jgi:5-methylthioadenosine/S-adenosylhomocysteine deaminase|nr:5-methylthioadenosine/S-adenosylhomocysteine deaminase [Deferribacteraceae bacterium]UOD34408.1 amidohydrolase family protein [Deferribacteraceae bacterium V6Fe1]
MKKLAIKAKYIYYNNKIHTDKFLLINNNLIEGISNQLTDGEYEVLDKGNSGIFPAFINTHTHLPMSYFRGLADDLPLKSWLEEHIWPAESKMLNEEFVYDATTLAAAEMIRSGTICANDMYFFSKYIGKALKDVGLRGVVGGGVLDFPTKFAKNSDEYLRRIEELIEEFENDELINISICPHAAYTVNPDNYKKCIDFANKYNIQIHTHLAETEWEVNEISNRYGKTPVRLFDEIGLFDTNTIFAHVIWVDDEEIEILGRKKANIAACVKSNLKLASGFIKAQKLQEAGANITIATDGNASNNSLNMFEEMSTFAKTQKGLNLNPTIMNAENVFNMSTKNAAKALNLSKCGELKKGNFADFMIVSFDDINMLPVYNPISHLVYTAEPSNVTDVFVNGQCLLKDRKFTTIDIEQVKEKAKYWSKKIRS